jgi:hypothetical protein
MRLWTKSRLIFNAFRDNAKASIRHVAVQTGLSKSSVHRLGRRERAESAPPSRGCGKPRKAAGGSSA